jgi:hypothetical protein
VLKELWESSRRRARRLEPAQPGELYDDDSGQVTLAAGQQQTIYSSLSVETLYCDFTGQRRMRVGYDSSGFSPFNHVSDFMACV